MKRYIFIDNDIKLVYNIQRLEADKFTEPFKYRGLCELIYLNRNGLGFSTYVKIENPDIMNYEEALDRYPEYFI